MRLLLCVALVGAVIALAPRGADAAECTDDATESLTQVREAYDLLSLLHVNSPDSRQLVSAAMAAVGGGAPTDGTGEWEDFATDFCAAWDVSQPADAVAITVSAIGTMTASIGDRNTRYLTPDALQ